MGPAPPAIEVFYDGGCPLCRREIALLCRLDRHGRVQFTDIDTPGFSVAGRSRDELMARIHGRLPDGRFVEGVDVFRRVYEALGFRAVVAVSRWPGVRDLLDLAYRVFARNRLRWTGRCRDRSCALPAAPDPAAR